MPEAVDSLRSTQAPDFKEGYRVFVEKRALEFKQS